MRILIETWVRVESIVEAEDFDMAYAIVSDKMSTKGGREEIVSSARVDRIIHHYVLGEEGG